VTVQLERECYTPRVCLAAGFSFGNDRTLGPNLALWGDRVVLRIKSCIATEGEATFAGEGC
jgi:hypothetical protein